MTIGDYLTSLGIEELLPVFEKERITLRTLEHLTDADMEKMGLPMGPRKILLAALGKKPVTARGEPGITVLEGSSSELDRTVIEGASPESGPTVQSGMIVAGCRISKRIPVASGEADLFEGVWQGKKVALKWYRYGIKPKADIVEKIRRIDRSCVVEVYESGIHEDRAYEMLEYIEHGSLVEWVGMGVAEPRVKEVLNELVQAVEALHAESILHRDIKPSNILVRRLNPLDLVLTDFGISSIAQVSLHQTSTNRTVAYSAPEALTGVVSKASDWWSVGVVILELLTGRVPFEGMDERAINLALVTRGMEIDGDLPKRWRVLLRGLLAQDHNQRWNAEKVREWLDGKEFAEAALPKTQAANWSATSNSGERRAAVPYSFNGTQYQTARELGAALAQNWDEGIKHYGRGYITNWLKNDLKDAAMAVLIEEITEDEKLNAEQKFSLVPLILNSKIPFTWKGSVVDQSFGEQNGELLCDFFESGLSGYLDTCERVPQVMKLAMARWDAFTGFVGAGENKPCFDYSLARNLIAVPAEKVLEQGSSLKNSHAFSDSPFIEEILWKNEISEVEAFTLMVCNATVLRTFQQRNEAVSKRLFKRFAKASKAVFEIKIRQFVEDVIRRIVEKGEHCESLEILEGNKSISDRMEGLSEKTLEDLSAEQGMTGEQQMEVLVALVFPEIKASSRGSIPPTKWAKDHPKDFQKFLNGRFSFWLQNIYPNSWIKPFRQKFEAIPEALRVDAALSDFQKDDIAMHYLFPDMPWVDGIIWDIPFGGDKEITEDWAKKNPKDFLKFLESRTSYWLLIIQPNSWIKPLRQKYEAISETLKGEADLSDLQKEDIAMHYLFPDMPWMSDSLWKGFHSRGHAEILTETLVNSNLDHELTISRMPEWINHISPTPWLLDAKKRYLKQLQIREQKLKSNFDRGNLWYWGFFFWVEAGLFVCAWVLFLVLRLLGWMLWVFFALVGAFLEALAEHNNGR